MAEFKENRKYTFTVEGDTEHWYLDWLQGCINAMPEAEYNVEIKSQVQQSPLKYAKKVNPIAVPSATHICDYESNDDYHVKKFKGILDELKRSNKIVGRSFRYELGYSNYTFELWMILHRMDFGGSLTDRTQYLKPINRAYGTSFESLDKYKAERNFKHCLEQLSISDVRDAIRRSKRIMDANKRNGVVEKEYSGFRYYADNPALTIWESVEKILRECGVE